MRCRFGPAMGAALLVVALGCTGCFLAPVSRDDEMIAFFDAHESQYRMLAEKIMEDGLVRVEVRSYVTLDSYPEEIKSPGMGLSADRWREYRTLIRALDLPYGVVRLMADGGLSDQISFVHETRGFVFAGDVKGVVFAASPPGPLVASLDDPAATSAGIVTFRHLRGPWYLFLDHEEL